MLQSNDILVMANSNIMKTNGNIMKMLLTEYRTLYSSGLSSTRSSELEKHNPPA